MTEHGLAGTYAPGGWVAVCGASTWLLIDLRLTDPRLERLWEQVRDGSSVGEVLGTVVDAGFDQAPGFGLAVRDGSAWRVIVRHPATILCHVEGAPPDELTARPGATWSDSLVEGHVLALTITHPRATAAGVRLPLSAGVTQADAVALTRSPVVPAATPPAATRPAATLPAATLPAATLPAATLPAAPVPEEPSTATDYGLLFGRTGDRDALLARLAEQDAGEPADEASRTQALQPAQPAQPSEPSEPSQPSQPASGLTAVWEPREPTQEPPGSPPAPPQAAAPSRSRTPTNGGLIDGVPWAVPAARPSQPPAPTRPPEPSPEPPTPPVADKTVDRSALLRAMGSAVSGPTVSAVRCPDGHLTAAGAPRCRVCGRPVEATDAVEISRPSLGVLRLPGGHAVELDRAVVLGRAPATDVVDPAHRPNTVKLSDSGDISRSHVLITLDGWQVLIRDLGSTNGTTLTLPGRAPVKLRAQEDHPLEAGCEVTLADEVSFRFEVTA